jgi:signal transduction histidine kinase
MGNFGQNSHAERFARVCQCHGGIQPDYLTTSDGSQAQARELRRLQQRAKSLGSELEQRKQLELSLREALKQRAIVERELRASLEREQEARAKSEASDAFKETFLGMIGHDLLNPLHTILTTSRLMKMRQELPEESRKRLERIIASGIRMQRMIEQIHDLTRSRLSSGLVISRNAEHDLVSMVTRIIDQLRTANPAQRFELRAEASCNALVDENRIEQVICNLIGNAIAHGDPDQPVRVAIWSTETAAHLTVHNFGLPIDPEFLPRLFEPFKTGRKPQGQSAGLGLGLYISERIIAAHGGTLEVDSSLDSGTCFRITLPLHCGDR